MKLKISPSKYNHFPLGGFLIKGPLVKGWLIELQAMSIELSDIELFPVPGSEANSIWGCFIIVNAELTGERVGKHQRCQRVFSNLYIPEKATLSPLLSSNDHAKLFSANVHLYHPDFGLVELENGFDLEGLIQSPIEKFQFVFQPEKDVFTPKEIKRFQIKPVESVDVLEKLEKESFPEKEDLPDKPLNLLEKGKLALYNKLFKKTKDEEKGAGIEKTGLMDKMVGIFGALSKKGGSWAENMQEDFKDLDKRNQSQVDRLMDMLKDDPEEALKYAIPLDNDGTNRGTNQGRLDLSQRWGNFSLFGNRGLANGKASGGSIDLGDNFYQLENQYRKTAEDLVRKKEYKKAAFVYMKLLKDYHKAAQTLEQGKLYQEAAEVYLKHTHNKVKAAHCYEQGNMTMEAIEIYEEMENFGKVGDLYMKLNKRNEAVTFYEKTADKFIEASVYAKASRVYRDKIGDEVRAQSVLLEGWEIGKDDTTCLEVYFSNITQSQDLSIAFEEVYANKVTDKNSEKFLRVVKKEFLKKNDLNERLREVGYEVIAKQVANTPRIIEELRHFNPDNKQVVKDTLRFKMNGIKNKKTTF